MFCRKALLPFGSHDSFPIQRIAGEGPRLSTPVQVGGRRSALSTGGFSSSPRAVCTGGLDPRDLKTALFCISFLRRGEVLAYVGRIHNLKDLKAEGARTRRCARIAGSRRRLPRRLWSRPDSSPGAALAPVKGFGFRFWRVASTSRAQASYPVREGSHTTS